MCVCVCACVCVCTCEVTEQGQYNDEPTLLFKAHVCGHKQYTNPHSDHTQQTHLLIIKIWFKPGEKVRRRLAIPYKRRSGGVEKTALVEQSPRRQYPAHSPNVHEP